MVIPSFKTLRPMLWGTIGALAFVAIYIISLRDAYLRNDAEPQIFLAYVGFPMSWLVFTIFNPLLEWLGPIGSIGRRIAEWALLGGAGILQYWLIGATTAFLINQSRTRNKE